MVEQWTKRPLTQIFDWFFLTLSRSSSKVTFTVRGSQPLEENASEEVDAIFRTFLVINFTWLQFSTIDRRPLSHHLNVHNTVNAVMPRGLCQPEMPAAHAAACYRASAQLFWTSHIAAHWSPTAANSKPRAMDRYGGWDGRQSRCSVDTEWKCDSRLVMMIWIDWV